MPEAVARFDQDYDDIEPRPARRRPAKPGKAAKKNGSPLMAAIRRRPGRAVFGGAFVIALVGIVANATLLQNARHPAPLFASATPAPASQPAAPAATAPVVLAASPKRP